MLKIVIYKINSMLIKAKIVSPLLAFVLYSIPTNAQNEKKVIKEGNDLYNKKKYEAAEKKYQNVLRKNKDT